MIPVMVRKMENEYFRVRGMGIVDADELIDRLMLCLFNEDAKNDDALILFKPYIDIGNDAVAMTTIKDRPLMEGEVIFTPAGVFEIDAKGSKIYVDGFVSALEDEYDDVEKQCEKIRICFSCVLGFVSDVIVATAKSKTAYIQWLPSEEETGKILISTILFYREVIKALPDYKG